MRSTCSQLTLSGLTHQGLNLIGQRAGHHDNVAVAGVDGEAACHVGHLLGQRVALPQFRFLAPQVCWGMGAGRMRRAYASRDLIEDIHAQNSNSGVAYWATLW